MKTSSVFAALAAVCASFAWADTPRDVAPEGVFKDGSVILFIGDRCRAGGRVQGWKRHPLHRRLHHAWRAAWGHEPLPRPRLPGGDRRTVSRLPSRQGTVFPEPRTQRRHDGETPQKVGERCVQPEVHGEGLAVAVPGADGNAEAGRRLASCGDQRLLPGEIRQDDA